MTDLSRTTRHSRRASAVAAVLAVATLVLLAGCETAAVSWIDQAPVPTSSPSPLAHPPYVPIDTTMQDGTPQGEFLLVQDLLREAGAGTLLARSLLDMAEAKDSVPDSSQMQVSPVAAAPLTTLGDRDEPIDSTRCVRSMRVSLARGRGRVAVWWSRRANHRAWLVAAWRDTIPAEGRLAPWRGPIVVDSLDQGPDDARAAEHGAAGCNRPAPSLAVDDASGYVHVAYALVGPEGPGVFYAHQMDPRSAFEMPLAIVYGEQLGVARVAVSGNVVAVAYEDPNGAGAKSRVGLAVSRTSGHLFEERLIASGTTTMARDPYVVVRGRAIVEGWSEIPSGAGEPSFRLRRARVH